jgi:hypothetical protein
MSFVIDHYEDILTTMVEIKSEGDSECSSKATSHTRAKESFDFIICLVISYSISLWFASCTAADWKALQRVIKTAQKVIGCPLLSLEDVYNRHCLRRAHSILRLILPSP